MDDSLTAVLSPEDIVLGHHSDSMNDAIEHAGGLLVARGSISDEYIEGMKQRETKASTYLGNGVALPHGLLESKDYIRSTGIVVVQHPDGVDWQARNRSFGCGSWPLLVMTMCGYSPSLPRFCKMKSPV